MFFSFIAFVLRLIFASLLEFVFVSFVFASLIFSASYSVLHVGAKEQSNEITRTKDRCYIMFFVFILLIIVLF